ncbi:hypothetical protein J7E93_10500 [Streptomyces sp. ISL-36]|uniref:hypothetical protein n=1 Tax=Streptomyces sp. ISL-36 TaxID=2819182 RepID=UPI001BED2F2B|nr:hypothetical protein [Streptomyces sp. ISL-36]MBT2440534.1 hypothetical protein [Streptomyces sp. ISL-36]
MVTARRASGSPRARINAGPLRLLWLAALLLGFLYTHAAGAESASAHITSVPAAQTAVASPEPDEHRHDGVVGREGGHGHGGHSHPAEVCDTTPTQDSGLPTPRLTPLAGQTPAAGPRKSAWAARDTAALPPLRSSVGSVVQQV